MTTPWHIPQLPDRRDSSWFVVRNSLMTGSLINVRNKMKSEDKRDAMVKNKISAKFICIIEYTGCNRRSVRDFGRVFLRSNYTDITQNTYIKVGRLRRYWPEKRVDFLGVCVLYSVRDVILPSTSVAFLRCSASDLGKRSAVSSV